MSYFYPQSTHHVPASRVAVICYAHRLPHWTTPSHLSAHDRTNCIRNAVCYREWSHLSHVAENLPHKLSVVPLSFFAYISVVLLPLLMTFENLWQRSLRLLCHTRDVLAPAIFQVFVAYIEVVVARVTSPIAIPMGELSWFVCCEEILPPVFVWGIVIPPDPVEKARKRLWERDVYKNVKSCGKCRTQVKQVSDDDLMEWILRSDLEPLKSWE